MKFKTTKEIKIPSRTTDQVIGQDHAIDIIKKAAKQKRNVLLIGDPGVGKSLVGQALSELLPTEELLDVAAFPNSADENVPIIKTFTKGKGKEMISRAKIQAASSFRTQNWVILILILIVNLVPYYLWKKGAISDVIYAASIISSIVFIVGFILFFNLGKRMKIGQENPIPKLLVDNSDRKYPPFIDATGSHTGSLLGDVLHDPLQSGGLGTPPHERLIPGLVHRANGGVLFIDEISTLSQRSQQELLTALQEKKYPITGQSERSSGAQTRSEPVPTDFILVAAGNLETIKQMHPALRSRIRGYGYEVYMNTDMDDTEKNIDKMALFVAQEVAKDKKIPHFTKEAVGMIVAESRRRSETFGKLTLRLRELGGLIRAAGDVAKEQGAKVVEPKHITEAKVLARTLEQQIADQYIERKKKYEVIITKGNKIGRVNGLAVIDGGTSISSGIVLPIESEVTLGGKKAEFIATGKLGEIAKEAVKNVSATILKFFGEDIKEKYDIYIQFLQTIDTGVEGDSASIAVAAAIISALKKIPVKQDTAMTGSLSVRGEVLAVGGVTSKIEAAIEAGIKNVIIPRSNEKDISLPKQKMSQINIIPVKTISEVLEHALVWTGKESILKKIKSIS